MYCASTATKISNSFNNPSSNDMAKQTQPQDATNTFPINLLPPLDNLSCSALDCPCYDIPIHETAFDDLPFLTTFQYDPLYSSLDIVPSQTLFGDEFLFGYENEFGSQPKNDQLMLCLENSVVEKKVELEPIINSKKQGKRCRSSGRKSNDPYSNKLSRKKITEYFYVPISQAAKELNVGLTVLKKRCRELGISRWPQRKLTSLQTLIKNVQALDKEESEDGDWRLSEAIKILKEEIKLMEEAPDIELGNKTKRLRQACYKAKNKKKKLIGMDMKLDHQNHTILEILLP